MGQFRQHRLKLSDRYIAGQPAEGEDQVGEPGDQVFLHMDEMSRYVGSVRMCWRGRKSSIAVDVALSIIRDVNRLLLFEFCMRSLRVKIVRNQ